MQCMFLESFIRPQEIRIVGMAAKFEWDLETIGAVCLNADFLVGRLHSRNTETFLCG